MNIKSEFEKNFKMIERARNEYQACGNGVMSVYLTGVLTGIKYMWYPFDHDMKAEDLEKITKDIINSDINVIQAGKN